MRENERIHVNAHRRQILTSVKNFVLHHVDTFSNRLLHQPSGIDSRRDTRYQMASLKDASALFLQFFRREFKSVPFFFGLTDLRRSNILVVDDWNTVFIIDPEFAYLWPVEFVQPPVWLDDKAIGEVIITSFAATYEGFAGYVECEEALSPNLTSSQEPLSSIMRQGWILRAFRVT